MKIQDDHLSDCGIWPNNIKLTASDPANLFYIECTGNTDLG